MPPQIAEPPPQQTSQAPAPAPGPAPARPAPLQTGSPVPGPTGREIKVTAPNDVTPSQPAKPGSAKARLAERLRANSPATPEPKPQPAKPSKPAEPAGATKPVEAQKPVDPFEEKPAAAKQPEGKPKEGEAPTQPEAAPAATDDKKPKQSPWKLLNEYKEKNKELERQVIEARNTSLPAKEKHELTEALKAKEERLKELEEEIRFVNYKKSEEFKTKYEQPYQKAWSLAMADIRELTVTNPDTGEVKQADDKDFMEIIQLPLGQARALAEQKFGSNFANDVMQHRKEIRTLVQAQRDALAEAREKGASRETETVEQKRQAFEEAHKSTVEIARGIHEKMLADEGIGSYLKPVEGDTEINSRLEKGYEMVDKWFQKNPIDPSLSPEDRAEIVRHQVAIRNRAAGFGALLHRLQKAQKQIESLNEELSQYDQSKPKTGGSAAKRAATGAAPRSPRRWDQIVSDLQAVAR